MIESLLLSKFLLLFRLRCISTSISLQAETSQAVNLGVRTPRDFKRLWYDQNTTHGTLCADLLSYDWNHWVATSTCSNHLFAHKAWASPFFGPRQEHWQNRIQTFSKICISRNLVTHSDPTLKHSKSWLMFWNYELDCASKRRKHCLGTWYTRGSSDTWLELQKAESFGRRGVNLEFSRELEPFQEKLKDWTNQQIAGVWAFCTTPSRTALLRSTTGALCPCCLAPGVSVSSCRDVHVLGNPFFETVVKQ